MKPPTLMDFPESFETERLCPLPDELGTDGEPRDILIYAMTREHQEASG
ncbi:MAG: hypothetical protein K0Q96_1315 [Rubrobacteraceae bacterium]|jgi:hypothetical protein|nr:hypothetical protein [Rubrobacteraceae bacterium]